MVNTPNMNLQQPGIGIDTGLTWELSINANSTVLDSHNHSPGSGVQITPLGFNINANLTFNNFQATNIYGLAFSAPASSALTSFLYTAAQSGGGVYDLFFNDGAGNVIPITKAGIVNAVASSIPGESYSGGTFAWVQGSGSTTPANFDIGSVTLRPNTAGTTKGIVLSPPAGIASLYDLALPAIPGATSFMQIDSSGNMSATIPVTGGITRTNLGSLGQQVSSSSGGFSTVNSAQTDITNLSITLTTTGRPVVLFCIPDISSGSDAQFVGNAVNSTIGLKIDGSQVFSNIALPSSNVAPPSAFYYLDTVTGSGTHTYQVTIGNNTTGRTTAASNMKLVGYETGL